MRRTPSRSSNLEMSFETAEGDNPTSWAAPAKLPRSTTRAKTPISFEGLVIFETTVHECPASIADYQTAAKGLDEAHPRCRRGCQRDDAQGRLWTTGKKERTDEVAQFPRAVRDDDRPFVRDR